MKTFKDAKGREWTIDMTVAAVSRVKDLAHVDLLALLDAGSDLWGDILRSPVALAAVLHAAVRPALDSKPLSLEEFGEGFSGQAITDGLVALEEDLISFFPAHLRARALEAMLAGNDRAMERLKRALKALPAPPAPPTPPTGPTDGGGSTNSPGSSVATPAPSPSAASP